jgi:hypothetical protein
MRDVGGIQGVLNEIAQLRRAVDDVESWYEENVGVRGTKNDICARVVEENVF